MMQKTLCPECDAEIKFYSPPNLKQSVTCESCRTDLTVISAHPVQLDWAFLEPFEKIDREGKKNYSN